MEEPSTSKQQSDSNSDEDPSSSEAPRKKKNKRQTRGLSSKLNANLKGLMGEANLRYARGDIETAQKMCFEIMRQVPDAYEPYITLAQIFENSDQTKYEGYLAIASCLATDASIWCRLAELYQQQNKIKDAIMCYTKAIRINPKLIDNHLKRLELVESTSDTKFALACKKTLANHLPKSQHEHIIDLCKSVTKKYHEDNNYIKALETIEILFKRIPDKISHDLINMLLELLLITERFAEILDCFIQYYNFTFEITVNDTKEITVVSYVMPPNVPIDLKVKFISCLIKLKSNDLIPNLINQIIIDENVEEIGDLYLDLTEDLMTAKYYEQALKLLVPLVKSNNFSLGAVWLKYADCLYNCNMLEQAVEAYFTVMSLAPNHVEILYPLAMSLIKLNKKSEALEVLAQDYLSTNTIDVAVLIERMKLLKQINDFDEYWKCFELLLSRHCLIIKYPEEIKNVFTRQTIGEKARKIQKMRTFRGDATNQIEMSYESIREPSVEEEYKFYKEILKNSLNLKHYSQFQRFAVMALTSKKFTQQFNEIFFYALLACIYNNDTFHGYSLVRDIVIRDPENNLAWNLFNVLLQKADDTRHNRFIIRIQERLPNIECLQMMEANYGLSAGSYNLPIKYYMNEFKKSKIPFVSFILGVTLLQHFTRCRNIVIKDKKELSKTVASLFLYYANIRSKIAIHETWYNLGRMYQHLGIMYLAEFYYLKVLDTPNHEIVKKYNNILDLKYEAAFNLHLIYKKSGNSVKARNILLKHIVI